MEVPQRVVSLGPRDGGGRNRVAALAVGSSKAQERDACSPHLCASEALTVGLVNMGVWAPWPWLVLEGLRKDDPVCLVGDELD